MVRALVCCAAFVFLGTLVADELPPAASQKIDYARDIEPLLQKRCLVCHGPQQQMKGLRLDQRESALRVVQPGRSADSRLIRMVSGQEYQFASRKATRCPRRRDQARWSPVKRNLRR